MEEVKKTFGEFITEKRTAKGISLRKMADLVGFSAPYWSDVEKDRKNPPKIDVLERLAAILVLSEDEKTEMLNLAGDRGGSIAPDIPAYIIDNDYVAVALRTARDCGAKREDWQKFIDELKQRQE